MNEWPFNLCAHVVGQIQCIGDSRGGRIVANSATLLRAVSSATSLLCCIVNTNL